MYNNCYVLTTSSASRFPHVQTHNKTHNRQEICHNDQRVEKIQIDIKSRKKTISDKRAKTSYTHNNKKQNRLDMD